MFSVSGFFVGTVRAVVTAAVVLAVAGCGASGNGEISPGSPRVQARCEHGVGFELSLASDTGGQPTPVVAAAWFAAHGGVQDLPKQRWYVIDRNQDGVVLRAGSSSLHVVQGSDGTWQVDSGIHCG